MTICSSLVERLREKVTFKSLDKRSLIVTLAVESFSAPARNGSTLNV
jgi:hypothetical protein